MQQQNRAPFIDCARSDVVCAYSSVLFRVNVEKIVSLLTISGCWCITENLVFRSIRFRTCYTAKHHDQRNATKWKFGATVLRVYRGWCVANVCFACDCSKSYSRDVIKSRALLCTPSQKTRDDDDATRHRSTTSLKSNIHNLDVCQKKLTRPSHHYSACVIWGQKICATPFSPHALYILCSSLLFSVCLCCFWWKLCVNIASFLQLVRYLGWFNQNIPWIVLCDRDI